MPSRMKGSDAATGSVGLVLTKSKIFDVRRIRVDLKKLFTKLTEAVA